MITHRLSEIWEDTLDGVWSDPSSSTFHLSSKISIDQGKHSESFVVFVSHSTAVGISRDELANRIERVYECVSTRSFQVVSEAIQGLLEARDFLGIQLDHAWGNISEADFNERVDKFLEKRESGDITDLAAKIAILMMLPSVPWDSESLSTALRCSISDVQKAITAIPAESRKRLTNG